MKKTNINTLSNRGTFPLVIAYVLLGFTAGCTHDSGSLLRSLDHNEQFVQTTSVEIKQVLDVRSTITGNQATLAAVDRKIAQLVDKRQSAYRALVLQRRPNIEPAGGDRFYHVPVTDHKNKVYWFTGEIPAVWHLRRLDTAVFEIAKEIRLHPHNLELPASASMHRFFGLSGTSAQSTVQPNPGDIIYDEYFSVAADSRQQAAEVMVEIITEFVARNLRNEQFEFTRLRVIPLKTMRDPDSDYRWNAARILDPEQRPELIRQISQLEGGRIYTDWRAFMSDGRFVIVGKNISISTRDLESGDLWFRTEPLQTIYQGAFFGREVPDHSQDVSLGEYAQIMRKAAKKYLRNNNTLKSAERSFNYCRVVGDLHCMEEVIPIFSTSGAKVNHYHKVLEAIAAALHPDTPTRILTARQARSLLQRVSAVVEKELPVPVSTPPDRPATLARQLKAIGTELEANEQGLLKTDEALSKRLYTLYRTEIDYTVQLSLEGQVKAIVETYL